MTHEKYGDYRDVLEAEAHKKFADFGFCLVHEEDRTPLEYGHMMVILAGLTRLQCPTFSETLVRSVKNKVFCVLTKRQGGVLDWTSQKLCSLLEPLRQPIIGVFT